MKSNASKVSAFILIFLLIIGLNYILHANEAYLLNLKAYGYVGTFLACLLLNATVLFPSSSTAVVISMATVYNPVVIALVGAFGTTLGEFTGYFAGYYGSSIVEKSLIINKILAVYNRFPKVAIILFAALPLPLFDVLGIMAGSVKMDKRTFFVLCFIGKGLKMLLYAYIGVYTYNQIQSIAS